MAPEEKELNDNEELPYEYNNDEHHSSVEVPLEVLKALQLLASTLCTIAPTCWVKVYPRILVDLPTIR